VFATNSLAGANKKLRWQKKWHPANSAAPQRLKGSKVQAEHGNAYLDADMGLADDVTDRALQAHMADLKRLQNIQTPGMLINP
jgi:phage gp29-like protein